MDQNFAPYSTPFSLYLAVLSGLFADKTGRFWIPVVAVTLPVLVGISLLVAWDVGKNGRLAAFMLTGFEGGQS